MEWDFGLPWYRPTRVVHVTPGSEFGWRSGWASGRIIIWTTCPPLLEIGPGSPTGVVFYNHFQFPARYPQRDVRLRLVARNHRRHPHGCQRRQLPGAARGLPGRPAAERHRFGRRSRRLAVLFHRRTRDGRGRLPDRVDRPVAAPAQAERCAAGRPPAAIAKRRGGASKSPASSSRWAARMGSPTRGRRG